MACCWLACILTGQAAVTVRGAAANRQPVIGGAWKRVALAEDVRRRAARDVVSILASAPQPLLGQRVLRVDDDRGQWTKFEEEVCEPIEYLTLARLLRSPIPPEELARDPRMVAAREPRRRIRSGKEDALRSVRGLGTPDGRRRWTHVNAQVRDGLAGRQVANERFVPEKELAALFDAYGPPTHIIRLGRAKLFIWEVDRTSKGAHLVRLSSAEKRQGETLELQTDPIDRLGAMEGLGAPRFVVAGTEISASKDYDTRIDFHWLVERLGSQIEWLIAREPDRVSRHASIYRFYDAIKDKRVALYYAFGGINGRVDWEHHEDILEQEHMYAQREARRIRRRLTTPRTQQFLLKGKGSPSAKRMGFIHDDDGWLAPCEVAFPKMVWLHRRYYESGLTGEPLSCEDLCNEFCERYAVVISPEQVRKILHDQIYSNGRWFTRCNDYRVWSKPVDLRGMGVPAEIFQRNQEMLSTKGGRNTKTKQGEWLLNLVPFLHADCMDMKILVTKGRKHPTQTTPHLGCYNGKAFYHLGRNPSSAGGPESCAGLSVDADVERVAVAAVRELIEDEELQHQYALAACDEGQTRDQRPSDEQVSAAEAAVEVSKKKLEQMAKNPPGAPGQYEDWTEKSWRQLYDAHEQRLTDNEEALEDLRARAMVVPPHLQALDDTLESEFVALVRSVLTLHTPEDPLHRNARAALFKALVSCVILHTSERGWAIEIQGPFFPDSERLQGVMTPLSAARMELDDLRRAGGLDVPGLVIDVDGGADTAVDGAEAADAAARDAGCRCVGEAGGDDGEGEGGGAEAAAGGGEAEAGGEGGEGSGAGAGRASKASADAGSAGSCCCFQSTNDENSSLELSKSQFASPAPETAAAPSQALAAAPQTSRAASARPSATTIPAPPQPGAPGHSLSDLSEEELIDLIFARDPDDASAFATTDNGGLMLSEEGTKWMLFFEQRHEEPPAAFRRASTTLSPANAPNLWEPAPRGWGPAWRIPASALPLDSSRRRQQPWTRERVLEGLRTAVRELPPGTSLTGLAYQALQQQDRDDIPVATWLNKWAKRHGTTAAALREEAIADVAAEREAQGDAAEQQLAAGGPGPAPPDSASAAFATSK